MNSFIKITFVFAILFIGTSKANTASEQMRSWYDFLSSIGNTRINPDTSSTDDDSSQNPISDNYVQMEEYKSESNVMTPDSYCRKETVNRLKHYCKGLHDGDYFDPWNPYCGFVRCAGQSPSRHICARGTWMGSEDAISRGQRFMCRRALDDLKMEIVDADRCPAKTDYLNMCDSANKVSGMNEQM